MNNDSRVGLALEGRAGQALHDVLQRSGYQVYAGACREDLAALAASGGLDAWVFDARRHELLSLLSPGDPFLLPADNPPDPDDRDTFATWSAGLLRQLDAALLHRAAGTASGAEAMRCGALRSVWVLAGSAGASRAVQDFLNGFQRTPPAAFIYAQHYDPERQDQLGELTLENPRFRLQLAEARHALTPGKVIMVPPRCKIAINRFAEVCSTRAGWEDHLTPNIDELLVMFAASGLPRMGVIIFSGMGRDGAAALEVLAALGCRIWAQDPDSAVCTSMPRAAIATGYVQRTGSPAQLASSFAQAVAAA